jgi:hypothetical protein
MARALRAIVHENATVDEAHDLFKRSREEK